MKFESPRLTYRLYTLADAETLFPLYSSAETMKYIRPPVKTIEEVREGIERNLQMAAESPGFGFFMMQEKNSRNFVGMCLLRPLAGSEKPEVGYMICENAQGNGYATEAVRTLCRRAFSELKHEKIWAVIHPENAASRRVLYKAGFVYEKEEVTDNGPSEFSVLVQSDFIS